jgi:hypothetical protein
MMLSTSVVPAVNSATSRCMPFEAAVNSTINLIKSFTFSGLHKAVTADLPHEEEATTADLPHKEDEDVRVQWDGVFDVDPNIGDFELILFDQLNEDELLNLDIGSPSKREDTSPLFFETSAETFPSPLAKLSINPTTDPSNDPSTPLINPTTDPPNDPSSTPLINQNNNPSNDSTQQPTEPTPEQSTKPFIQSIKAGQMLTDMFNYEDTGESCIFEGIVFRQTQGQMDTYDVLFCDGEIHNYSKTELAELIITAREGILQARLVSHQLSESIFSHADKIFSFGDIG